MQRLFGSCLLLLLLGLTPGSGLGADLKSLPDADRPTPGGTVTAAGDRDDMRGRSILLPEASEASVDRNGGLADPTGVRNRLFRQRQQQRHGEEDGNSGKGQQRRHRL